jgi:RNA polymerase sigma-70 factor, ECF subfamily
MQGVMRQHTSVDDAELARRIGSGDSEALGALYDRYAGLAMGTAMRVVRDHSQAEDVVHDAFVAAWQKIHRFDATRGTVRSWLLTIVRNRAIDRVRGRRASIDVDTADDQSLLRTSADPTQDGVMESIGAEQIRDAMSQLPDDQRTAIELAYFRGHTYREIAVITGVAQGTANGRLRLALAKLRDALRTSDAAPFSVGARVATEVDR